MTQNCVRILCLCLGGCNFQAGLVYSVWLLISVTQLIICLKGISVFACKSQILLLSSPHSETYQMRSHYYTTMWHFYFFSIGYFGLRRWNSALYVLCKLDFMFHYESRFFSYLVSYNLRLPLSPYWIPLFVCSARYISRRNWVLFKSSMSWQQCYILCCRYNTILQMHKNFHSCWTTSVFVCKSACSCVCVRSMYVGICLLTSVFVPVIRKCQCISVPLCAFAWTHKHKSHDFSYRELTSCTWVYRYKHLHVRI